MKIDEKRSCLRIAVAVPAKGTFFYEVPESLSHNAQVGCRALVPFDNRKITGYILEKVSKTKDQNLKEILDILSDISGLPGPSVRLPYYPVLCLSYLDAALAKMVPLSRVLIRA